MTVDRIVHTGSTGGVHWQEARALRLSGHQTLACVSLLYVFQVCQFCNALAGSFLLGWYPDARRVGGYLQITIFLLSFQFGSRPMSWQLFAVVITKG